ncbi:MAG: helix-turn-helix domain-containing protein [Leptospiraceae bacterium]|nr:helix-turn-helix domain-containing protein [Leptospiraceae bacterium]
MVISKRVGVILREAREERGLSLKDVARETNIAIKYIEALENEDFSQFPGETYSMGFLRNYVEFLNMDVEQVLNLYRGQQIDQSPAPVQELTRGSARLDLKLPRLQMNLNLDRKWLLLGAAVLIVGLIVALFASGTLPLPDFSSSTSNASADNFVCEGRELEDFTLPAFNTGGRAVFMDDKSSLRFNLDQHRIKLCLVKVERKVPEGAFATFSMMVDEESIHDFQVREREDYTLSGDVAGLKGLNRMVVLRPVALGDYTAQMEFTSLAGANPGVNTVDNDANTTNANVDVGSQTNPNQAATTGSIQVTLEFLQPSYLSWVTDGQRHAGRTWAVGRTVTLEANNRLEVKIGNAGGVRIRRDGQPPRLAGRPAQIVTLTYSMVPDPLDPAIRQIQESIR